jgi:hypothetical protein
VTVAGRAGEGRLHYMQDVVHGVSGLAV